MKILTVLKRIFVFTILIFCSVPVLAQSVRISQIDTSSLLINQNVRLYVGLSDNKGLPITGCTADNFSLFESQDGKTYTRIPQITAFNPRANYESGINFLLLIDNSGSMYRSMKARGKFLKSTKIQHAKNAVATFLESVSNPEDTVGIAVYNTYYQCLSDPVKDKAKITRQLSEIQKPEGEAGYTEIYASLFRAVEEFKQVKGRKALIILSDGENRPYFLNTKKVHPDFGTKTFSYTEPVRYCQEEGISVFAINFGDPRERKERHLKEIAYETGGALFDARDESELRNVYSRIADQIVNEYMIDYPATMAPADKKFVKVVYGSGPLKKEASRFYFSSTVFGLPMKNFSLFMLIPLLASLCLAWILSQISFKNKRKEAFLEVLNAGQTKAVTKMFTLNKGRTVIGGSTRADMTIIGGPVPVKENHATIVFDKQKKNYTVICDGEITVNNKPVKKRVLESGDVLDVGGATIVFNDDRE
ncbi:MAG TPA: VWA domain-containing protein [Spirochaetota bacterium]|nr:VWA domain-containing protein [Spirochaetota bacterium]HPI89067.1 VWA domain-containing protein [Spirochaetota bacterium]HPR48722.1 VWA domain-containing protein [Spirochaetota bacterium]